MSLVVIACAFEGLESGELNVVCSGTTRKMSCKTLSCVFDCLTIYTVLLE